LYILQYSIKVSLIPVSVVTSVHQLIDLFDHQVMTLTNSVIQLSMDVDEETSPFLREFVMESQHILSLWENMY
jgi:non-ribosomal peptide synthetase component F